MCRCLILLSTYNGEKYLPELLESVLAQKDIYVDILARDDGSTDKTVEILKKYDRVKVYGGNNLKPAKSFLDLIWKADINYDYYALCDQDDVWKEEKIISAVKCIENIDKPALYSSAVEVVDKDLTFIRKSFTDNTFKNPLYDILTYEGSWHRYPLCAGQSVYVHKGRVARTALPETVSAVQAGARCTWHCVRCCS